MFQKNLHRIYIKETPIQFLNFEFIISSFIRLQAIAMPIKHFYENHVKSIKYALIQTCSDISEFREFLLKLGNIRPLFSTNPTFENPLKNPTSYFV